MKSVKPKTQIFSTTYITKLLTFIIKLRPHHIPQTTTKRMCARIRESAHTDERKKIRGKVQLIIQIKLKRARNYKKNTHTHTYARKKVLVLFTGSRGHCIDG